MRKSLVVGVLREINPVEFRAPLTPEDVVWLRNRHIKIEIESSAHRIFNDQQYKRAGAVIVNRFKKATLLIGIKEPDIYRIYNNRIYMVFSHALKGQLKNIPLLNECIRNKITLVDYEKITDTYGKRIVYFGRFAGICGLIDSLYYLGKKFEWKGIRTPFLLIRPADKYKSLKELKQNLSEVNEKIKRHGFNKNKKVSPFIIGITGHGRVSQGVQEVLECLHPMEVHPRDMYRFVKHQRHIHNKIYKIIFHREEKFRSKNGSSFYFEDYLKNPKKFTSNLDKYIFYLNILLHTSYWDKLYPRVVTKEMIHRLYGKNFRLEFIGDLSCDVNGSIELTYKTLSSGDPTFTYDPITRCFKDSYRQEGITILAKDNLPTELPLDASKEFSAQIKEYVYQIAVHGKKDITNHMAIPREIREAVITENGKLTKKFSYLRKYIKK